MGEAPAPAHVDIEELLRGYDVDDLTVATVCSHTSLQIFHGARKEGYKTLGICLGPQPRFYEAFPRAAPDAFLSIERYTDLLRLEQQLRAQNVVVIPTGSIVEYLGADNFLRLRVPTFGNRKVLQWESDRARQREWLDRAGIPMPRLLPDPAQIDRPVFVKLHGAKGGRGAFIAKNSAEYYKVNPQVPHTIQEYVVGTRYYLHFFYSPLSDVGYRCSRGTLQLLGLDRRDESNVDEMYKLGAQEVLRDLGIYPSFVVTGNIPVVLRESLLPKVFAMGEAVVETALDLFGGMIGPFCLETIVTDKLEFRVFEISSRIVAGTNLYTTGSPYADYLADDLSTGRRIAQELRAAASKGKLASVLS